MLNKIPGYHWLRSISKIFFGEKKTLVFVQLFGRIFFFSSEKIPYILVFASVVHA